MAALENLIDCLYQTKPKYLIRSLNSLKEIKINDELLMDRGLISKINVYLDCLKNANKSTINFKLKDPIEKDLSTTGECNDSSCETLKPH